VPIICAWCQTSVLSSRAGLVFPEKDERYFPEIDGEIWNDRADSGNYTRYFHVINGELGASGEGIWDIPYLSEGYWKHHNEHESGELVVVTDKGLCWSCCDALVRECRRSAERAEPPCDMDGSWVGFTSKHVFKGGQKVGPTLLCASIAILDCIECGKVDSTMELITTGTDFNPGYRRDDGESWSEEHIKLRRGPMVDYIRAGKWLPWIIFENDEYGDWVKHQPANLMPKGWLTQDGWCCSDCDN
jgi:hypothetical protein